MTREITKAEEFLLGFLDTNKPITNQDIIDAYNEGFERNTTTLQEALVVINGKILALNHTAQSILNKSYPGGDSNFKLAKAKWENLTKKYYEVKKALKEIDDIKKMFWEEEKMLLQLEAKLRMGE